MKKLTRLLIAAALTFAAVVSVTPNAAAVNWCEDCVQIPDNCYACCRCDKYTHAECLSMCS